MMTTDTPQGFKTFIRDDFNRVHNAPWVKDNISFITGNKVESTVRIRTAEQEADIRARWAARAQTAQERTALTELIEKLENQGTAFLEVKDLEKPLSEDEIIARVGGGDLTKGSCSSLALTYLGNVCGFDVLDFRDGTSRSFFANKSNIERLALRIGGKVESHTSDFQSAFQLLKQVVPGKEYYFCCGKHAAVVRKLESGAYEYLELQSATKNGFKRLTTDELGNRFGAKKSHTLHGSKYQTTSTLIDADLLKKDASFRKLLGYINTQADWQMKGSRGTIK
jgi:hypothetical protein